MPEVSAAKRHSISDTANATPTNQCISLSPGSVLIWVEGQMRDTWPRDFEAFSIWLHVASLSLRDVAFSACWGWHLHVNFFFLFFLVLKPLSWSSLARVDHQMYLFSSLRLRIWRVVNVLRALINTARPSPFCVSFKNYWLLNTWQVSHKEVSLFSETQRPLIVSMCFYFSLIKYLVFTSFAVPVTLRVCLRACSNLSAELQRRCFRLSAAGPYSVKPPTGR